MSPESPTKALGPDAPGLRALLVDLIRTRHDKSAEAHVVSESRYGMGFGSQWRDLLDDTRDALTERGFRCCKLTPGGHEIPVVNDSLIYVWRVPGNPSAVDDFAASPTRRDCFSAAPLDPMLWEPSLSGEELSPGEGAASEGEVAPVLRMAGDSMPLVLVMIESTPLQLQSIDWAIAVLNDDGKVELRGQEPMWRPELVADGAVSDVEAFDSGSPVLPTLEPREKGGSGSDV